MSGSVVMDDIRKRLFRKNNSYQNLIVGPTGSGKSFTGITFVHELKPDMTVRGNVLLTAKGFLNLINSSPEPGTPFMGDEIGKWYSSRDWYLFQNKVMSIILETHRYLRLAAFWTVPTMRMVDITLRSLCHATTETLYVDEGAQRCVAKYKFRKLNPMTGKYYDIFPRKLLDSGERVTIDRIRVARPPRTIEEKYLDMKEKHLGNYYSDVEKFVERAEKGMGRIKKTKKEQIMRDLAAGMKPFDIAVKRKANACYVRAIASEFKRQKA
jgi:ABC-type dipeptide/oligopeptide/nickel transport system ATPase component